MNHKTWPLCEKLSLFIAFFWCKFFPTFERDIETYRVSHRNHSECGVIRVRSTWRHETSSFNSRCFPLLILEYNHSIIIYWALFSEEVYCNFCVIYIHIYIYIYIYIYYTHLHMYICTYAYIYTYIYKYNVNTYM